MVSLRSKLHLARQGRKLSPRLISDSPCLLDNEYDPAAATAAPTQRAGSSSAPEPSHLPTWSAPRRLALDTLPDHLVQNVAISCGSDAILGLRHTCRSLHRALDSPDFWAEIARRRMDPPTNGTPGRDVLIQMIKAQMDSDHIMTRDQDARRDAFLCLAVTIPPRQRARIKATMGPLLARARIKGSGRGPPEAAPDCRPDQQDQQEQSGGAPRPDQNGSDCDVAAEIEARLGLMSTLCVLGYSDVCDVDLGRALMAINPWTMRANIWSEKKLLAQKQLSLQLAFTMTLGLIHPWNWSNVPTEAPEYQTLARRVMADYHAQDFTSSNQSFWLSWEGLHTRSLQLAGLMAYILKTSGLEDTPRSDLIPLLRDTTSKSNSETVPTTSPPSSSPQLKIPLLEKTKGGHHGGITGQSNSWQEWYTSRVRDLVNTIDEDDDDEWYGYYVYTLTSTDNRNPIGSKDPAMENIHFKLGRPPPPTSPPPPPTSTKKRSSPSSSTTPQLPQKLPLEARDCQDGITRSFDLVGTVAPATGIVSLRKNYVNAHSWDYEGVMTPLGIVGEWGKEETGGFNGYFWLWRRSWMGDGGGEEGRGQQTYAYA